jgi:Spy/CpxP family protein refolding chaperone
MTMHKGMIVTGLMLCAASLASAQEAICVVDGARRPPNECGMPGGNNADPLARYFFPPELVMAHQQAINLTDRQRSAIQEALKEAQGKFIDQQFAMSGEVEKLQRLIQGTSVEEPRVLEQVDRVLNIERQIKHAQLGLMIRIKNQLTERQQAQLGQLRRQPPGGDMMQLDSKQPPEMKGPTQ